MLTSSRDGVCGRINARFEEFGDNKILIRWRGMYFGRLWGSNSQRAEMISLIIMVLVVNSQE
jgi:hypothetical protein